MSGLADLFVDVSASVEYIPVNSTEATTFYAIPDNGFGLVQLLFLCVARACAASHSPAPLQRLRQPPYRLRPCLAQHGGIRVHPVLGLQPHRWWL